jgi:excisionase family DNA binding protein
VYATIRRYRVDADLSSGVIERIIEEFMPLMRVRGGVLGYYLLDAHDGAFATLTICEDQGALEASNEMANEWMRHYLATRLLNNQQGIRPFSVEVKETFEGPLYGGLSEELQGSQQAGGGAWVLSVEEVCEALGMAKSWVYRRLRSGEIPSVRLGRSVKVRRQDLDEYLEKHRYPARSS